MTETPSIVAADAVRAIDWSASSLGPRERWPTSLRAMLDMVLANGFAMALAWGEEHTLFYNDAFVPILGSEKHPRAMGADIREVFAEAWPVVGALFARARGGETIALEDLPVPLSKNGQVGEYFFTFSYSPVTDDDGATSGVLVTVADTTERVNAVRRSEESLREVESARRDLLDFFMQAPLPMCIMVGPRHFFALANPQYIELVGREVRGKEVRDVFTEEEAGLYVPMLDQVLRTNEPVITRETPMRLPDREGAIEERLIDVGYHPYRDRHGAARGVLVIIQDVTASVMGRVRAETALQARDQFLSIASHELRTPLTAMRLQTQLAKKALRVADVPPAIRKFIDQTGHGVDRMARLVDDMLDISRIQSGRLEVEAAVVCLVSIVRDNVDRFGAQLSEAGIDVTIEAPDALTVRADHFRIDQVLTNLVTNAIRYAPGAPLRIEVRPSRDMARVAFEDGGPGIAPEDRARVFERFERGISASEISGLGIGLFIAREIVLAHGGSMTLESGRESRGARFVVDLPRA